MEKQVKKNEKLPDYTGFDSFISQYVDSSSAEQLQALSEGTIKYNIGKTEAKKLLQEKINLKKKEEKAVENVELEKIKQMQREEREQKKREREIEAQAEKMQKKMLLDELEATWEKCSDDLFQVVCEEDWRKAKFYFVKRLLAENTYEEGICGLKTFQDNKDIIIYQKEEGIYCQDADIYLSAEIEKRFGEKATNMQVKEILDSVRRQTYFDREDLQNQPKHLRAVGNGLWDIEKRELQPFTPKHIYLNKIGVPHISSAQCPKFKIFLSQILNGEKEILVLQEWLGYCLLNDVRFAKALLLFGDGENGKSVLLKTIKHFLGEKNVTSISLQYLESNPFAPVRLFGKCANIFADLPKKALSQTSVFKMAVAGDPISGEKKGKDSFEFLPYAKMMFSCNEVPRTPDRTRGFFRRWLILVFNQHFPEGDPRRDENLFEKLKSEEEMEGILQFALEGLYRLLEQKAFTKHMSLSDVEKFWISQSDSVAAFVDEMVELSVSGQVDKTDVFDDYEAYCNEKGYISEEQNHFWKRFKDIVDFSESQEKTESGYRKRVIRGVRLLPLSQISTNKGDLIVK